MLDFFHCTISLFWKQHKAGQTGRVVEDKMQSCSKTCEPWMCQLYRKSLYMPSDCQKVHLNKFFTLPHQSASVVCFVPLANSASPETQTRELFKRSATSSSISNNGCKLLKLVSHQIFYKSIIITQD